MPTLQRKERLRKTANVSPLIAALNLIGDGWTFLILREAFFQVRRFEELHDGLCIPRARLAERLNNLVEGGVFTRTPYQTNPSRYEYTLSAMGRNLYNMTLVMKAWADKWRKDRFPFLSITHATCGSVIRPVIICAACQTVVTAQKIRKIRERSIVEEGAVAYKRRALPNDIYARGARREAVAETLKVMGDQRSVTILHEAFQGATRFGEFHERTGVARNTLTLRLNHLVREGVFEKCHHQETASRSDYRLTVAGWDLLLVDLMMEQWARRWLFGKIGPTPSYLHLTCGAPLEAVVICKTCTKTIDPVDAFVDSESTQISSR